MPAGLSLLVIDDSADDRELYRRALTRTCDAACNIVEAEDGDRGLAQLAESPPDCVLLDYSLPGRNGVEVLKCLRARHPFVPVVMLTGQGSETVAVTAMQEGAQNYISKAAITPETLERAIRVAVDHCAMQRRIEEQRGSLEIFTRALAHDLKEPVRTIKSFLALLAAETFSDQGRGYFSFVQSATNRMEALIDAVYFYTRLDGSVQQIAREACDAGAVLEDAKADIAELVREHGAVIASGPLPQVFANRRQLSQLLQNLLGNAIHHSRGGPIIQVEALESADYWTFRVSDNGPGIDALQRERIFEPFKRLAHAGSKGLGLGLAICRRIVEAHGGKIWCEAGPQGGAVFAFTLPRTDAAAQPGDAAQAPSPAGGAAGRQKLATILLVDDSEADIALTRILLCERPGLRCKLLTARDATAALDILREAAGDAPIADLILLDINMPGMDGFELLDHLRSNVALRDIPVVICSTSSYDKDLERARRLGAAGYLVKPADLQKLRPLFGTLPGLQLVEDGAGCSLHRRAGPKAA